MKKYKRRSCCSNIIDRFISIAEVGKKTTLPDIINAILAGDTVILIDNIQTAIVINSRAWEKEV